jgi:DNA-directed RNA polymerase beta subunit
MQSVLKKTKSSTKSPKAKAPKAKAPKAKDDDITETKIFEADNENDFMHKSSYKKDKITIGDYKVNQDDLFSVGDAEIDAKGLVDHHLSSGNNLYTNGITQIITSVFKVDKDIANQRSNTPEDNLIDRIHVLIKFTDVFISRPTMINYYTGKEEVIYPNIALKGDKTYSANLNINATIIATAYMKNGTTKVRNDVIKNYKLCKVPVMVKSILCNTHGMSKESLMQIKEDPTDPGGYFIIKGVEWVIDCIENILYNQIRVFKNEGYSKEIMRGEIISKPGDTYQNSSYFLLRLLNDNQMTCEIVYGELKGMYIPFYLLFRVLGWSTDKEMIDNIIYGYSSDISKNMINYITDSMNAKYSTLSNGQHIHKQKDVLNLIVDEMKNTELKYLELDKYPENYQRAYDKIFNILDMKFLAHVGTTPADRPNKLRYLALIVRKLFLVRMGNMEPTDRDSYKSKRVAAAGTSYAKIFKTHFNASIIQNIKRRLTRDFRAMSFSQVDLASSVKSSVYAADFERSIMQAITSGNKSQIMINKKAKTNRLSSQLLGRKNQTAVYSTLRQVSTTSADSSKQSERANEMRRVHMSFLGYIDLMHSSTGEKVGINKQLALFAGILKATSSQVIKDTLLNDKDVIPLCKTSPKTISEGSLRNVYVNGEWIGCSKDCLTLAFKYRKLRRSFDIHPLTTIHWDNTQDEVFFWVDVGRVVRPLMIVYNNKRDPEMFPKNKYNHSKGNFVQGIGVSQKVVDGLKTGDFDMEYLLRNNLVEYITAEEQANCYLCPFFNRLRENKTNELTEYTHCDIPQAILGLTSLTGPYANHNQLPRITFQTSQCQQTCGVFALNWPYRCDKDTFLQYVCETPLIKTVATKYIFPNGCNTIVAIACYSGYERL